jgi:hypothetical protein
MSASFAALQLGYLPWKIKRCQQSVWSDSPTDIEELDDLLDEITLALPALADRLTADQRSELSKLLQRLRTRHQTISQMNVSQWGSLVDTENTKVVRRRRYREYLADAMNHRFREWQKEDWTNLRDLLAIVVKPDKRLQGYYELADHLGDAIHGVKRGEGPLSRKQRAYILAGMKRLPLREQSEVKPFFLPVSLGLLVLAKRIQKLGRFLQSHEADLVARPTWDGRTITYRQQSEHVRIQAKSVMTVILDEGEKQGWPDAIRLSASLIGNKRSVANAIHYFQREHKLLEFSVNGDRVLWGAPGTLKRPRTPRRTRSV